MHCPSCGTSMKKQRYKLLVEGMLEALFPSKTVVSFLMAQALPPPHPLPPFSAERQGEFQIQTIPFQWPQVVFVCQDSEEGHHASLCV